MPNPQFCMSLLCMLLANQQLTSDGADSNEFHILPVLLPRPGLCVFLGFAQRLRILRLVFDSNTPGLEQVSTNYSKRRICTGRMLAAARAGTIVAATLMASAAATIHTESSAFA